MADYADIAELDVVVRDILTTWNKTINYAASFTVKFQELEGQFASGRYGPEWTFSRWLIVKCGMSHRTCCRIILHLNRQASDEQRERTQQALEQERQAKAQLKTDYRATKLAWNGWLFEEKQRIAATQAAWDEWRTEEKQRIEKEKQAKQCAEAEERRRAADRERARRYRRDKKAKKEQHIKQIGSVTLSDAKNEKVVPLMALDGAPNQVPLQVLVPISIREQLGIMAARQHTSLRSLILRALKDGLGISEDDEWRVVS